MRGEELREVIDVFFAFTEVEKHKVEAGELRYKSRGKRLHRESVHLLHHSPSYQSAVSQLQPKKQISTK
jgi:hypothetical protein